jgi:fatty-acyl-CoA synthase
MREFLKTRLAKYKIPAYFEVFDEFPYLASGKVDGITLKKLYLARIEDSEDYGIGGIS